MSLFECCYKCVPPKRHSGCHATCPEYKESRDALDNINQIRAARSDTLAYITNSKSKYIKQKHLRGPRR